MHYVGDAFAIGNDPTILDKSTDEKVEQNYEISPQDFELLNEVYDNKCPEKNHAPWILVLDTLSNVPLKIDGKGQSEKIRFTFEKGTQVYYSCSLVWLGKMFVFGGWKSGVAKKSTIL